jgi:hydroxymethylbilane synthase
MKTISIGTRRSPLALWQARHVASLLKSAHESLEVTLVPMDTLGDRVTDRSLPSIGSKGLFTEDLERALLEGTIDMAVHSLKDVPTDRPDGLILVGSPGRACATDSLVTKTGEGWKSLPQGATVGTGSVRRRSQLLSQRPDLRMEDLRGNIDTRLGKLEANDWSAILMATAALKRLSRSCHSSELEREIFVPAVGQGALGIEIWEENTRLTDLVRPIIDATTTRAVTAERLFMQQLEGGCSTAVAAHCFSSEEVWVFHGWVGSRSGSHTLQDVNQGTDPSQLAKDMAVSFLERGALEILKR